MNHPAVIQLCRALIREIDRPRAGTSLWNADAQTIAETLLTELQAPDPTCGSLLIGEVRVTPCQRPLGHQGDHGSHTEDGWRSWPKRGEPVGGQVEVVQAPVVPIRVKDEP